MIYNKTNSKIETEIIKLYNLGHGTIELSKFFKKHRSTIQSILKRNDTILRKCSFRKYWYNINFFKEYNKYNCYWAGYILADGCLRSDRKTLNIKTKDKEHLDKFKNIISYNKKINKNKKYPSISINGNYFYEDLYNNFHITPQKTYTTIFPQQVPKELLNHFIRGIFDGDGCITYSTCPSITFVGTNSLLDSLRYIFKNIDVKLKSRNEVPPLQHNSPSKLIAMICYSGKNAYKILKWIYKDSEERIRLNRKYNKYNELFEKYR